MSIASAFAGIPIPSRPEKPRQTGMTMMIDWGLPLGLQADILRSNAGFIDLGKVAVGLSGLYEVDVLRSKISLYQEAGVTPFPGGMFLEYALAQDAVAEYWSGCRSIGYTLIEVSDNAIHLEPSVKRQLIRDAINQGFDVLGEVGSKHVVSTDQALVDDVRACLDAGAGRVLIEAAELVHEGTVRTALIERLNADFDQSQLMWELPGSWIQNVHEHDVHALAVWLVETLGPDTNIANVMPFWVPELETLRTGVGVRTLMAGGTHG